MSPVVWHSLPSHCGKYLLITDVVMPEMNGKELAEKVRNIQSIKVLYMSGYTANIIASQGILKEGLNFLEKPFSRKDISAKVRKALTE